MHFIILLLKPLVDSFKHMTASSGMPTYLPIKLKCRLIALKQFQMLR